MTGPVIVEGFASIAVLPLILAAVIALLFWRTVVPRQLRGLQVAFETGPKRYEVHTVTETFGEARDLLRSRGMRFGVATYLFALTGALLLFFEYTIYAQGWSDGFHAPNIALALILIILPAVISSGSSLGAQIIKPIGQGKAKLQESSRARNTAYIALTAFWFIGVAFFYSVLGTWDVDFTHRLSATLLLAFSPSIVAYGRVMGTSWQALRQSSAQIAQGKASPFHNHSPNARQQVIARIVHLNTLAMPVVAINTLLSLIAIVVSPELFTHSDQVIGLEEYREQATIMEEGGILGFFLIELFSNIPDPGLRVPLVTSILLFLLLNVALVGFLFVYEVARILFLDVQDVSGRGGIRLADSRLLRAERSQQAKVLNFCFTGFAGQSMLLLALAMITFWDSSFLPQGASCGDWENTLCNYVEKDAMEELTWMLASGGQICFLLVWLTSLQVGSKLDDITFDASISEQRQMLTQMEDMIYLKQRPFTELIGKDLWTRAIEHYDEILNPTEDSTQGLDLLRQTGAKMQLFAGLNRWEEAEENAVSLLALQTGRDAQVARLILAAASLCQRDLPEAAPRLALLNKSDVEAARLQWFSAVLDSKRTVPEASQPVLSIDPITRRNIDLLRRTAEGKPQSSTKYRNKPADRLMLLGDCARMRLDGRSEEALSMLEGFMKQHEGHDDLPTSTWTQGRVVTALLHLDANRPNTAVRIGRELRVKEPRHPHVRSLIRILNELGLLDAMATEPTKMTMLIDSEGDWMREWPILHTVHISPRLGSTQSRKHAGRANAWIVHSQDQSVSKYFSKSNLWKKIPYNGEDQAPHGLYLHLYGVITTIAGMPVDLGLPGGINIDDLIRRKLV
ncbi:MAG: tetratricopeptide repeat protein [Candidatus Poseidoniaceae archaeon]